MIEVAGGMVGGLGLFFVGMWLLTENLKTLASRRLRMVAHRWTEHPLAGFSWGALAGSITQSSSALTFLLVSMLRSRLISTRGAFVVLIGGNIGTTLLVLVVTFDIELIALYCLGVAGMVMVVERASTYRPIAACFFSAAMIILGLVLLKESAAPLADQPWFGGMVDMAESSLLLSFLVGMLLSLVAQSSIVVCVIGVSMATLGVIAVDHTIMLFYGSVFGVSLFLYVMSSGLTGRARQVVMYQVFVDGLGGPAFALLFFVELHFDIPLLKALVLSIDWGLGQQLAILFILISLLSTPVMIATLGPALRLLERLWPATAEEDLSQTQFIHQHAFTDVENSLALVDLEQRRVLETLPRYFDTVRQGTRLDALRAATRSLLSEIDDFLSDLSQHHLRQSIEDHSSMLTRQKLLYWLEEEMATLCVTLQELPDRPSGSTMRSSVCEGVEAVFLTLLHAIESGDDELWSLAKKLTGDRSKVMGRMRSAYWKTESPLDDAQRTQVMAITNTVELIFFLLSKLVQQLDASPIPSTPALMRKHAQQ